MGWARRWRCRGWNRAAYGATPGSPRRRPARRRRAWPSCFPAAVITGTNGGPRARVPTWSWARCSRRLTSFATRWCSSAACTMPRRSRATSTVRKPATCSPARRWPRAGGSSPARASINWWRGTSGTAPSCRASCSAAKRRTPRCTRITRCSTARTSRGAARPRRRRSRSIPRWRLMRCSKTRRRPATKACSTPCCPMPGICAATSAGSTSKSSTNI